jgi:hypothetical protein
LDPTANPALVLSSVDGSIFMFHFGRYKNFGRRSKHASWLSVAQ